MKEHLRNLNRIQQLGDEAKTPKGRSCGTPTESSKPEFSRTHRTHRRARLVFAAFLWTNVQLPCSSLKRRSFTPTKRQPWATRRRQFELGIGPRGRLKVCSRNHSILNGRNQRGPSKGQWNRRHRRRRLNFGSFHVALWPSLDQEEGLPCTCQAQADQEDGALRSCISVSLFLPAQTGQHKKSFFNTLGVDADTHRWRHLKTSHQNWA